MAITSPGIGSGLDINSLISKLMAIERKPLTALDTKQASYETKISALGKLSSAVSALQSAAQDLQPAATETAQQKFATYSASVADTTIASATTSTGAVTGSYSLEVSALAKAHRLVTAPGAYADSSAAISTGTLTIQIGSASTNVVIDSSNATLSGLRDAINDANAGVNATIISGTSGAQLVLTSADEGTTNQMTLSGLTGFDFDSGLGTGSLSQETADGGQAAQDAALTLNGIAVSSSSNTVSGALDGVTLQLTALTTSATTLTVTSERASALTEKLDAFVTAYNDLVKQYDELGYYDSTTKTAGPLNGDYTLRLVQTRLRSDIFKTPSGVTGDIELLSDIGITLQSDGTLAVDSSALSDAIAANYHDVAGFVAAFGSAIDSTAETFLTSDDGTITSAKQNYSNLIDGIDKRRLTLEYRLSQIEARYRRQFTALDTLISSMNSTSSYLQQQLANLPGA